MADYNAITDTQLDPDAPLTSQLGYQWRDNPEAIATGAAGATRVLLGAFERLVAGDDVRSSRSMSIGDSGGTASYTFAFTQIGTIKITGTASTTSASYVITRHRGGAPTILYSSGVTSILDIASVDVLPFDLITVTWSNSFTSAEVTVQLKTDGGNLWCGNPSQTVGVIGNTF